MMANKPDARKFAEDWVRAWNCRNLDAVLSHYRDDFEFSSPLVTSITGEASGSLKGKEAVRAYWEAGLALLPDIHFTLVDVLTGVRTLTVLYKGHRGLTAEVFEFDESGLVAKGSAMYPTH